MSSDSVFSPCVVQYKDISQLITNNKKMNFNLIHILHKAYLNLTLENKSFS